MIIIGKEQKIMIKLLVMFLFVCLLVVGIFVVQQQAMALSLKQKGPAYTPSKEFTDYNSAPPITQSQEENALKAAFASKTYNNYKNYMHGQINIQWTYPYTGAIYISTIVGSEKSDVYGLLWFDVDNNGKVLNEGFSNWYYYW